MDFYAPIKDIFGSSIVAFFFGLVLGFMLCKTIAFFKFFAKWLDKRKTRSFHATCSQVTQKPIAITFQTKGRKTLKVSCPLFDDANKTCTRTGFICTYYED